MSLTSDLGFTRFYVDNAEELGWINLNPLGQGGDFIAFPVVGDIGFDVPPGNPLLSRKWRLPTSEALRT